MKTNGQAPGHVERHEGIITVRGGGRHRAWNGIEYKTGMWAENVGSNALSMNVAMIPPGGVAKAHIHVDFEVMLYILQGNVRHEFGLRLEKTLDNEAGDFIFIEPGSRTRCSTSATRSPWWPSWRARTPRSGRTSSTSSVPRRSNPPAPEQARCRRSPHPVGAWLRSAEDLEI